MLTLQFIPYQEIEDLTSRRKINKLLSIAKQNNIVLLEGRLSKDEEASLIQKTMEEVNSTFKGIELGVIYPEKKSDDILKKLKTNFINMLLGNRQGLTIIGPASIVKEIKQDPDKIQLLTKDDIRRKKK